MRATGSLVMADLNLRLMDAGDVEPVVAAFVASG
jgi:hypothetical protein